MLGQDLFLKGTRLLPRGSRDYRQPLKIHRDVEIVPELRELENFWPQTKEQEELGARSSLSRHPLVTLKAELSTELEYCSKEMLASRAAKDRRKCPAEITKY